MVQWPEADAALLLASGPWQSVINLLAHMDTAACSSPCQISALRRIVQEHLYPRIRRATAVQAVPAPVRAIVERLQAWLVAGILQTPVAVRGTGFFSAFATHTHMLEHAQTATHAVVQTRECATESDECACAVCGDRFAIVFDDDVNAWVYTDAVRAHALVHADCV